MRNSRSKSKPRTSKSDKTRPDKEEGWIVDLAGNLPRFGEVKDLRLVDGGNGKWAVYSNNRQLTNVRF